MLSIFKPNHKTTKQPYTLTNKYYNIMKTTYEQQAENFAAKYNVKLSILDVEYRMFFDDDKEERYVFKCKLTRDKKSYTFNFGQSIANFDKDPDLYDILSCLTKYDVGSFEDFCSEFGYDEDSRKSEKIYKGVVKEWKAVERLFGDCLEELQEIS